MNYSGCVSCNGDKLVINANWTETEGKSMLANLGLYDRTPRENFKNIEDFLISTDFELVSVDQQEHFIEGESTTITLTYEGQTFTGTLNLKFYFEFGEYVVLFRFENTDGISFNKPLHKNFSISDFFKLDVSFGPCEEAGDGQGVNVDVA